MNLDVITGRPVIIFSSPRTGSTVIAETIFNYLQKKDKNIKFFNEVFNFNDKEKSKENLLEFSSYINNNDNYVLKVHLWDFIKYFSDDIKHKVKQDETCLIRIRRKDLVAQVVSYYVESQRRVYGYTKEQYIEYTNKQVGFYHTELLEIFYLVKFYNKILDTIDYNYDFDLYYEEFNLSLVGSFCKTPQPTNYKQLYNFTKKIINSTPIIPVNEKKYAAQFLPHLLRETT